MNWGSELINTHDRRWRYLSFFVLCCSMSFNSNGLEFNSDQRYFEYQQAAQFTHLKWHNIPGSKINLNLASIQNYSGIPIESREADTSYFSHGKLPSQLDAIYRDAFESSRYFQRTDQATADYHVSLILDEYQLPFPYAPDDHWYQALKDQTDRWAQSPSTARVKLTLKLSQGQKPLKTWMDSVEMLLSHCDVNLHPQPSSFLNNQENTTQKFLASMPGQAFLAATNFLILQTIRRLEQESLYGRVTSINGQHIHLQSDKIGFIEGSQLKVFPDKKSMGRSAHSTGSIKVIKTTQNLALAYPVSLRADHIKVDDWVEMGKGVKYPRPKNHFVSANQCATVITADMIGTDLD